MSNVTVQRRKVRRSVTITACEGQRVNPLTGELEDFYDALIGTYDAAKATRSLRRMYRDETILILKCETDTDTYEMSIEDFVKHSTKKG